MLAWLTEHGASLPELVRLHQTQIESPRLREMGADIQRASSSLAALADSLEKGAADEAVRRRAAKRALVAIAPADDKPALCSIIARKLRAGEFPLDTADAPTLRTYSATLASLSSLPDSVVAGGYSDEARTFRDGAHGRMPSLALRKIADAAERFNVPSRAIARVLVRTSFITHPRLTDDKEPATWRSSTWPTDGIEPVDHDEAGAVLGDAIERWARALDDARYEIRRASKNRGKRRRTKRKPRV